MTIEEINQLIQTVVSTGIAELEVQRGDNRVWVKRSAGLTQEVVIPAGAAPPVHAHAPAQPVTHASVPGPATVPAGEPDMTDPSLIAVTAPIVGTFYEAPAPGAAPFVQTGDIVNPGKILCIIESMKLMNEIECDHSGVIVKRLVENGQPVEYGETLFFIKPS